ncbi:MAG: NAD-dependent deacylase [Bacteroidales bacterium]|nr:NAD-dependent deacylase [Bacteroidales bacterium]MDD4821231.1 NAD-dependent deacylase [Bacteroidales bacterium]
MKIVVFTGAGVSADSGLCTFRGGDGLWDSYRIEDICTADAIRYNREEVIRFYNIRRKELLSVEPNPAHVAIHNLEAYFEVQVVTQNIDDLHERAGSSHIIHLHGELRKLRSTKDESLIYPIEGWEQDPELRSKDDGALLRPFVVFFGESVPQFEHAAEIVSTADLFVIVGTSLAVYPAASLLNYVRPGVKIFVVDPDIPKVSVTTNPVEYIQKKAALGMPLLADKLIKEYAGK